MKYFEIITTETSKGIREKADYSVFNNERETFLTLEEAKNHLKEKYGKTRRQKMYRDTKEGKSYQSGWIYSFRNKDWSHDSEEWLQKDWVEIREIESNNIL